MRTLRSSRTSPSPCFAQSSTSRAPGKVLLPLRPIRNPFRAKIGLRLTPNSAAQPCFFAIQCNFLSFAFSVLQAVQAERLRPITLGVLSLQSGLLGAFQTGCFSHQTIFSDPA